MLFAALGLSDVVDIINNAIRGLFANLCQLIYPMIASLYQLFTELGKVFYNDTFSEIYDKISMIIGVFMVFRVVFWLIELLVSPDKLTDKEKNPGKIIQKVLISVVLLAITPRIFKFAFNLQYDIVNEHLIESIIVTPSYAVTGEEDNIGRLLSAELFSNFYTINKNDNDEVDENCERFTGNGEERGIIYNRLISLNDLSVLTNGCLTDRYDSDSKGESGMYKVNFNGLFAVGIGAVVFWMILMYCISIGTRYVQLVFLQVIAPIPIMCYLTPQKDNMLSKWVKQCTTTYLDLFIRILIISFVMLLIKELFNNSSDFTAATGELGNWVKLFLVLGLLTFAKKAPDLIQELLPKSVTKASGDFGLSWKKRTDAMLGGKLVYNGTKKAVGFAAAAPLALAKNVAVRGYNAAKYNERQNKKAEDYRSNQIARLQEKMKNQNLSAAEKEQYAKRIENLRNKSTHSIRNDLKKENRRLQQQYANISDSDPNAKEKRAKLMEQITANSDMIGYRNQATTLATSLLGGLTAAGGAAIHENGIGKIIKKSSETETQRINREQGWFKDNPATFGNAVRRTISVIQKKYGFETEGQAVQYAIDDLDAGIKKQKEEVTKLQEVEKAYSNNKSSVKAVETEGSGDLAKNKKIRVHGGKDANGQDIWKDVVLSTRTNAMKNALERTSEYYKKLTPEEGLIEMSKLGEDDVNLGMLRSLISTIVNNADPSAPNKEEKIREMMDKAKSYSTVAEAFNGILSDSTQQLNKAEADYGKEQAAAGLMSLLARSKGITIDSPYTNTDIENAYDAIVREVSTNPTRYSEDVTKLLNEITAAVNEEKDINEKTMSDVAKSWSALKEIFNREQAVHARETADANDALQDAQHEKEAFQRYIENTVNINNDKYGGSGK